MSFFRDYLREHDEQPDLHYQERDESWFVYELLLIRLGFSPRDWPPGRFRPFPRFPRLILPYSPFAARFVPDPMNELRMGQETEQALRFVSVFLCFFVPKPPRYRNEISAFKEFFIPSFAAKRDKQLLLFKSVLPNFSRIPAEVVMRDWRWDSIYDFVTPENNPWRERPFCAGKSQ